LWDIYFLQKVEFTAKHAKSAEEITKGFSKKGQSNFHLIDPFYWLYTLYGKQY